ncbi:hemerythrin domain-containing protein [Micromonospora luteifusca]|uniref:hemerythrin domain-containing protein n=1 Tax=Micromonospora luteifusca TaxID=709860 RepID=UPI0027DCC2B1|nr:hemerythrin domain-containing protein [Micromonospora luteifusca]
MGTAASKSPDQLTACWRPGPTSRRPPLGTAAAAAAVRDVYRRFARRDAFDDLVKLLGAHETAEEEVVHPLARSLPGSGGDAMVDDRLEEERQAKETLRTLIAGGVDADGFDTGINAGKPGGNADTPSFSRGTIRPPRPTSRGRPVVSRSVCEQRTGVPIFAVLRTEPGATHPLALRSRR